MEDLISRKALLEHKTLIPGFVGEYVHVRDILDAPAVSTEQRWIPVTERLPEDDLPKDTKRKMIRCLVATDRGTVKCCVRQRWEHFNGKMQPWMWNKDLYAKPTHWMPLPEPPKEVQ